MSSMNVVIGYIRKEAISLSCSDNTLFQTIPQEIMQIVLFYWMLLDPYDLVKRIGKRIETYRHALGYPNYHYQLGMKSMNAFSFIIFNEDFVAFIQISLDYGIVCDCLDL